MFFDYVTNRVLENVVILDKSVNFDLYFSCRHIAIIFDN